jgi:soluble cytochrome b562
MKALFSKIGVVGCLVMSLNLTAAAVDLEKTMKDMAFQYKQAYEATSIVQITPHITSLKTLTSIALTANFPEDKAVQFKQGLEKVLQELTAAEQAVQAQDLTTAKQHLKTVDALRKQYHKQRKVSIWQLLFG